MNTPIEVLVMSKPHAATRGHLAAEFARIADVEATRASRSQISGSTIGASVTLVAVRS
jgi:hypothetical protein